MPVNGGVSAPKPNIIDFSRAAIIAANSSTLQRRPSTHTHEKTKFFPETTTQNWENGRPGRERPTARMGDEIRPPLGKAVSRKIGKSILDDRSYTYIYIF